MAIETLPPPTQPDGQYQALEPYLPPDERPTMVLPTRPLPVTPVPYETAASQPWVGFKPTWMRASQPPLEIQWEALALLRERMERANRRNRAFKRQYARLESMLLDVVARLRLHFANDISHVTLTNPEFLEGIDLRELDYAAVTFTIVLINSNQPYNLYRAIATEAFSQLDRAEFLFQFRLVDASVWRKVVQRAIAEGRVPQLGVPMLRRRV